MIIDADVHISPYPDEGGIGVEELLRRMDILLKIRSLSRTPSVGKA